MRLSRYEVQVKYREDWLLCVGPSGVPAVYSSMEGAEEFKRMWLSGQKVQQDELRIQERKVVEYA